MQGNPIVRLVNDLTTFYNYSTIELLACANNTYILLENIECGGKVYLYLIIYEILEINTDDVTAFKMPFKKFKELGIYKIQGENIRGKTK